MALTIRLLNHSDYDDILTKWWADWKWEAPSRDFLPQDGEGGLIVYDEETPVCSGFLYSTNSRAAWVDFIISNKEYRKKPERQEAISLLIDALSRGAEIAGAKYIYALIKNKSLIGVYQKLGYIEGDSYTSEMIKVL